jgi:hypothetical protein
MPSYRYGTNRGVLLCHSMALKFALHERGARCNLFEARTYASSTGDRRAGLCPVLWCSHNGAVLAMAYATPIPEEEFEMLPDDAFPDWEYVPGTAGAPFEHDKAANWGRLGSRLVAVDYSAALELYD